MVFHNVLVSLIFWPLVDLRVVDLCIAVKARLLCFFLPLLSVKLCAVLRYLTKYLFKNIYIIKSKIFLSEKRSLFFCSVFILCECVNLNDHLMCSFCKAFTTAKPRRADLCMITCSFLYSEYWKIQRSCLIRYPPTHTSPVHCGLLYSPSHHF